MVKRDTPLCERAMLSKSQAGDYLSVSARTIGELIASGKLKAYRVTESRVALKREELDAYVANLRRQTAGDRNVIAAALCRK